MPPELPRGWWAFDLDEPMAPGLLVSGGDPEMGEVTMRRLVELDRRRTLSATDPALAGRGRDCGAG